MHGLFLKLQDLERAAPKIQGGKMGTESHFKWSSSSSLSKRRRLVLFRASPGDQEGGR